MNETPNALDEVNGDLWRAYRRRRGIGIALLALCGVLLLVISKTELSSPFKEILIGLACCAGIIGTIMKRWSGYERDLLDRPEKEPPSILKGRY